jgi:hypothetical protein
MLPGYNAREMEASCGEEVSLNLLSKDFLDSIRYIESRIELYESGRISEPPPFERYLKTIINNVRVIETDDPTVIVECPFKGEVVTENGGWICPICDTEHEPNYEDYYE